MAASELIMTNGATPATPSSGKTKVFINSSKKLAFVDDAGLVTALVGGVATTQSSPADPTGTTNTTGLMMGIAGTITPVISGRVHFIITGTIKQTTSGDGANVQLRHGTGSAPANAAALTGTTIGGLIRFVAAANNQTVPFCVQGVVTGLTLATAYWIDLGVAAVTAGTASVQDLSVTAVEF